MKKLFALLAVLLLAAAPALAADHTSNPVRIEIQWMYRNFTPQVMLYEAQRGARLWEARSVPSLGVAPVGARIEGPVLMIAPGQDRRFVLVVQNPSDKPLYFFAAPHVVQPPEEALGFKFKCLCVNRAYMVGPHETWYRVVEFRLSPDFSGHGLTVMHSIIGIDEKRAESFSKDPVIPEF